MMHLKLHFPRVILLAITPLLLASCDQVPDSDEQIENLLELLDLPANQWVEYHHMDNSDWWKKGHAGLAYDSKRGSLLIFGSNTHGNDWDNTVHEFLPIQRRWIEHGSNAPDSSYRIDAAGNPVSGTGQIQPWAMHTYDGVEYDPEADSLLVTAAPDHNPIGKTIAEHSSNPVWRYNLATKEWQAFKLDSKQKKGFFGAATAYDSSRKALMICNQGLWTFPSDTLKLSKIFNSPSCLHRTMAYDNLHRDLFIFGAYKPSNQILKLRRDILTDEPVEWLKLKPTGAPPPFTTTPVAFDQQAGVFLLIVDNPDEAINSAVSYVYDPVKNKYIKLANGGLEKVGMNFMLAWAEIHKVFFLVTGGWDSGVTVWALRLDLSMLEPEVMDEQLLSQYKTEQPV